MRGKLLYFLLSILFEKKQLDRGVVTVSHSLETDPLLRLSHMLCLSAPTF